MLEALASGALLILLDQWSKRLARMRAANRTISCGSLLQIRRAMNSRRMYNDPGGRAALVLIWLVALLAAFFLWRSGAWFQGETTRLGLGLAFGGAAGNLLDILRVRGVFDFIDLRWWPMFNLADVGIIAGLLVAFWPRV